MSPNIIGLIIGFIFIVPTIYLIRSKQWDNSAWPWLLVTLPIYYMLFGLLAMDTTAIIKELLYGLPYIATGLLVWRIKSTAGLIIIGLAWLSHGLYDLYHDVFFVNPGVFSWYPAFCAFVDISVAAYILVFYKSLKSDFGKSATK